LVGSFRELALLYCYVLEDLSLTGVVQCSIWLTLFSLRFYFGTLHL